VPEQYVHRIGRTARAGAGGHAISFCAPDERAYLRDIERLTKQSVPVMEHDLSLRTPSPDARVERPRGPTQRGGPPRKHAPKKHHGSDTHGQAHAKQGRAPSRARDDGDRRDRKGHDVWSNGGRPPQRRTKRPPQRAG